MTAPGGWGPRVDGGAWSRVDGVPVDRIHRDVDRVRAAWALPAAPADLAARTHGLLGAVAARGPDAGPDLAEELVADVRRSCPPPAGG